MNITPENITELRPGQIFVFGSNEAGRHGAGAARQAIRFGAVWGCGTGLCGRTYALPTKDAHLRPLPLGTIDLYIGQLVDCARSHPELQFLVTAIGCGLAGFTPQQIAPLFLSRTLPGNISLPRSFIQPKSCQAA
jgi:hypothetical protein